MFFFFKVELTLIRLFCNNMIAILYDKPNVLYSLFTLLSEANVTSEAMELFEKLNYSYTDSENSNKTTGFSENSISLLKFGMLKYYMFLIII